MTRIAQHPILIALVGSLIVALMLLLAACNRPTDAQTDVQNNGSTVEQTITLRDGRHVTCLTWTGGGPVSGMSCDWTNAR